jgi:2-oxoglutarate dehydrogenase E1 component
MASGTQTGSQPAPTAMSWHEFYGPNAAYVLELYEQFLRDASSVDPATRAFFERWRPPELVAPPAPAPEAAVPVAAADAMLIFAVGQLATSIREYGHRAARLDPLGSEPPGDPELDPATHGLREADLERLPASAVGGPAAEGAANAREAIANLRRIYCGTTGYDFDQVQDAAERAWLRDAAESERYRPPKDPIDERALLDRLSEVGAFERFLHRTFPGQTRFSIEGTGMLIPMLDEIIGAAAEAGTRHILIGMAHRGRLNVLAHILRKPYTQILEEFKAPVRRSGISGTDLTGEAFTGDVKYHLGARRAIKDRQAVDLSVTLAPNPSHLEYVNPVVEGMARAADERRDRPGLPVQDETASLPLLIHGDAAFPGQGVVAETLNLSRLPGYRTGGTIHVIVNNQIGFTTEPSDARSTLYASDLAKGFEIPIVHVNADDPEACIAAARLAHAYRERFHKDFLIDLIGYRRWGHNEGEDPTITQPLMYQKIASHPTVRELWAAELVRRGLVTEDEVGAMLAAHTQALQAALAEVNARLERQAPAGRAGGDAGNRPAAGAPGVGATLQAGRDGPQAGAPATAWDVATGVPLAELEAINDALWRLPDGFTPNPRLERFLLRSRREAFAKGPHPSPGTIDWGHAEALAFATILRDGTPIRLTGQDTVPGTFGQRQAVLRDVQTGTAYTPLHYVPGARASFEVRNSPLSEVAVLGFEYGYSVQAPDTLVLWEAQYGDFVNSAQVIVDQFITSARSKWGQEPSLVLLLPHGYEGQGPEHSSARPERFLQAAAEDNIRVVNCTTAAQYFHLLRRHAALLRREPRPLVVMTPKRLLREPLAAATPAALAEGTRFQPVLDDPSLDQGARKRVRRVILCSGKVYYDLAMDQQRTPAVALVRIEQWYPFPAAEVAQVLAGYSGAREALWVQEEPQNMGAWTFMQPRLEALLAERGLPLRYVGRPERASPAEGERAWHIAEQARIVAEALGALPARAAARGHTRAGARADGPRARAPRTARSPAGASRITS